MNFFKKIMVGCLGMAGVSCLLGASLSFTGGDPANIFITDSAEINLNCDGDFQENSLEVILFDEQEKVVARYDATALANGIVPLPARGYYRIVAQAVDENGKNMTAETTAAVIGPMIPDEIRLKSPFGCCGSGVGFAEAGARFSRLFFELWDDACEAEWKAGFPTENPPKLHAFFKEFDPIYAYGPQPHFLLDVPEGQPPAKRGDRTSYPIKKEYEEDFDKLIHWAMKATSMDYSVVAMWNEPVWGGTLEQLGEYTKLYAGIIHKYKPGRIVIGPCHCDINFNELQRYYDSGMFDYLDGIDMHAYVKGTEPEGEFIDKVRQMKKFFQERGHGEKPIYITEYGWTVPPGDWQLPVTPLQQAQYCARSLILLAAEDIKGILWFCLRYGADIKITDGYGMIDYHWNIRPSYAAYSATTRALADVDFSNARVYQPAPYMNWVVFPKNDGTGYVHFAWTTGAKEVISVSNVHGLRSMTGTPLEFNGTIELSGNPVHWESNTLPPFASDKSSEVVTLQRNTALRLPWKPDWIPTGFRFKENSLFAPADARIGEYIMYHTDEDGSIRLCRVNVISPVEVRAAEPRWTENGTVPGLFGSIRNYTDKPLSFTVVCPELGISSPIGVPAGGEEPYWMNIEKWRFGVPFSGHVQAVMPDGKIASSFAFDMNIITCERKPRWFKVRNSEEITTGPINCLSKAVGSISFSSNADGLIVDAVTEDVQAVDMTPDALMWGGDCLQLAFDLDAANPWEANRGGWQAHFAYTEYGIGAVPGAEDGAGRVYRWLSYKSGMVQEGNEPAVQATVKRKDGKIIYHVFFPWSALGADKPLVRGDVFSFAAIFNNDDGEGRRCILVNDGIFDQKDPRLFGKVFVR